MMINKILSFILLLILSLLTSEFCFSQQQVENQYTDLYNIIFTHNFEENTVGSYVENEWKQDWNSPSWANKSLGLGIIEKDNSENKYLKIPFPEGMFFLESGVQWHCKFDKGYEELYLTYRVKFSSGFNNENYNGKLPGLSGGTSNGAGDMPDGTDGWSGRYMFHGTRIGFYLYHPEIYKNSYYNDQEPVADKKYFGEGVSFDSNQETDKWYIITQRIVMNTVGENDGLVEGYVDGKLVAQKGGLLFRTVNDLQIDRIFFSNFFGGSGIPSEQLEYIYFDDFYAYTFNKDYNTVRGNVLSPKERNLVHPLSSNGSSIDVLEPEKWNAGLICNQESNKSIKISWNKHLNAENYIIERKSSTTDNFKIIDTVSSAFNYFFDTDINVPSTYIYRVRTNELTSENKTISTVFFKPSAPEHIQAEVISTGIMLKWEDIWKEEEKIEIFRSNTNETFTNIRSLDQNTTFFLDNNTVENQTYYYKLRVFEFEEYSDFSEITFVNTSTNTEKPANFTANAIAHDKIQLNWKHDSVNITSVFIEASKEDVGFFFLTQSDNATGYIHQGLESGEKYYYRISFLTDKGITQSSAIVNATTISNIVDYVPNVPDNVSINMQMNQMVNIAWNDNSNVESYYHVERSEGSDDSFYEIARLLPNSTFYVDSNFNNLSNNYYRIRASNQVGYSDYSSMVVAGSSANDIPEQFKADKIEHNTIQLSWLNSGDSLSYEIEKTDIVNSKVYIVPVSENTTIYVDSTISPESTYKYRIRSKYNDLTSKYSAYLTIISKKIPNSLQNTKPLIDNYELVTSNIQISWKYDKLPEHFLIERSIDDTLNFFGIAKLSGNKFNYIDPISFDDRNIYYRIIAVKDNMYSDYSNIVKTINPKAFANEILNLNFTLIPDGNDTITLYWNDLDLKELKLQRKINDRSFEEVTSVHSLNDYKEKLPVSYDSIVYQLVGVYDEGIEKLSNKIYLNDIFFKSSTVFSLRKTYVTAVELKWENPYISENSVVTLFRSSGGNEFKVIDSVMNQFTYQDINLKEQQAYSYYLKLRINEGLYINTDTLSLITDSEPVFTGPVLQEVVLEDNSKVNLRWQGDSVKYVEYIIERSINDTTNFNDIHNVGTKTYFLDKSVEEGNHYFYRVKMLFDNEVNKKSNVISVYVPMTSELGRNSDGLVASYNFSSGNKNVYDISDYIAPVDLTLSAGLNSNKLKSTKDSKIYISSKPVTKVLQSVKATSEFSVECWLKSSSNFDKDIQQIVALENNSGKLFSIFQDNLTDKGLHNYFINFRTVSTNPVGKPDFYLNKTFDYQSVKHIVYTRDNNGNESFYVDGVLYNTNVRPSNLDNWTGQFYLVVGGSINGDNKWYGNMYHLSFFNKVLSENQIQQNYKAGAYTNFHEENSKLSLNIYPNPASNNVHIKVIPLEKFSSGERTRIVIVNNLGQILFEKIIQDPSLVNNYQLDVSNFPNGFYNVILKSDSQLKIKKFIIKH